MLSSLPGLPLLNARSTPSSQGVSPVSRPSPVAPSRRVKGAVTLLRERDVSPLLPTLSQAGVSQWVWQRFPHNARFAGASSFAWVAVFQESERNPLPMPPHSSEASTEQGQAGKSRQGTKRGFQAQPSYWRRKCFLQASNWAIADRETTQARSRQLRAAFVCHLR